MTTQLTEDEVDEINAKDVIEIRKIIKLAHEQRQTNMLTSIGFTGETSSGKTPQSPKSPATPQQLQPLRPMQTPWSPRGSVGAASSDISIDAHELTSNVPSVATHADASMLQMLRVPDGESHKVVDMRQVLGWADEHRNEVYKTPSYVRTRTNRDSIIMAYIDENLPELLAEVPVRSQHFPLLTVQRLAIIAMVNPLPKESYMELEIDRDAMKELSHKGGRKQPFHVKYTLEAGAMPAFTIADFATGAGKTVIAITAAFVMLISKWKELKANYKTILRSRTRDTHSGLCKGESPSTARLSRLAIAFVPSSMVGHWYDTAMSVICGFKDLYGNSIHMEVWRGTNIGRNSIQQVYDSGMPTVWILPIGSESNKVLTKTPGIDFAVRIFDEMNQKSGRSAAQMESMALFNYLTHATPDMLEEATKGTPRHPLRLALGGNFSTISNVERHISTASYPYVDYCLNQHCKMSLFSVPRFLREAVSCGVIHNMPAGLIVNRLRMSANTLTALAMGSGVINLTLEDFVLKLLTGAVHADYRTRIRNIFSQAEHMNCAQILEELDDEIVNMSIESYADVQAKQAIKRLRTKLGEIFEGDIPSCPVTLEPIERKDMRILRCCTAVISSHALKMCTSCPLCRSALSHVATISEPSAHDHLETDNKSDATSCSHIHKRPKTSDAFEDKIHAISEKLLQPLDAIVETIGAQVAQEPSSRILLCFAFQSSSSVNAPVDALCDKLRAALPGIYLYDLEKIVKTPNGAESALDVFNDLKTHNHPVVFILNTKKDSKSVQGLNLWRTDLTIMASKCDLATQRQAAGRSLRMRKRPETMAPKERFPYKRLIIADLVTS